MSLSFNNHRISLSLQNSRVWRKLLFLKLNHLQRRKVL